MLKEVVVVSALSDGMGPVSWGTSFNHLRIAVVEKVSEAQKQLQRTEHATNGAETISDAQRNVTATT
jgi:hypothetical protein